MSAHHRTGDRSTHQVICDRIEDRVAELTEPRVETLEQWVRSADGTRLEPVRRKVDHPSLVGQLQAAASRNNTDSASGGYESKPVVNVHAMAALQDMQAETRVWVKAIDPRRAGRADMAALVARLWFLADRAPTLTHERLLTLDFDVMRWWSHARVTTTWGDAPIRPHVPCSECGKRGSIRVTTTPTSAVCLECGAAWDQSTIGALGEHVRLMLAPPIDELTHDDTPITERIVPLAMPETPAVLGGLVS